MANAAGIGCRVICSGAFIRRFFIEGTGPTATCPTNRGNNLSGPKPNLKTNLWQRVVIGALPHPIVVSVMAVSSGVVCMTSPCSFGAAGGRSGGGDGNRGDPWNIRAAAKHVGIGALCFALTAFVFARFEQRFLRELRSLWAARRSSDVSSGGRGGGGEGETRRRVVPKGNSRARLGGTSVQDEDDNVYSSKAD